MSITVLHLEGVSIPLPYFMEIDCLSRLVIIGYPKPYLESFIFIFLLFRVYVRGAAAGLQQSYHPYSLLSVVICFAASL